MKILFICSYGQVRSVCGAALFKKWHETKFVGTSNRYCDKYLSEYAKWAELIFVMKGSHQIYMERYHPEATGKMICLNLDDIYGNANSSKLKAILFKLVSKHLKTYTPNIDYNFIDVIDLEIVRHPRGDKDDYSFFMKQLGD